jgi:nitrous oxidase accessory protein NosD
MGASGAQLIADAATRSLIEGTDFGDNIMAALPNVIGSFVGSAIADGIAGRSGAGITAAEKAKLAAIQKQKIIAASAGDKARDIAAGAPDQRWSGR